MGIEPKGSRCVVKFVVNRDERRADEFEKIHGVPREECNVDVAKNRKAMTLAELLHWFNDAHYYTLEEIESLLCQHCLGDKPPD